MFPLSQSWFNNKKINWSLFCPEMSNTEQNIKCYGDVGANCMSHARQNNLPPKKRFENKNVPSYKEGEASSQEIQNQESKSKTEDSKTVSILPGVIRHTSCPNSSLAYYYDYNASSK